MVGARAPEPPLLGPQASGRSSSLLSGPEVAPSNEWAGVALELWVAAWAAAFHKHAGPPRVLNGWHGKPPVSMSNGGRSLA